jgi:hypothetical protein
MPGKDHLLAITVAFVRRHVVGGAVSMLAVVPTHELRHPSLREG